MFLKKLVLLSALCFLSLVLVSCGSTAEEISPTNTISVNTPVPQRGPADVESIEIFQIDTFPVEVNVVVRGHLMNQCTIIDQITQERAGSNFEINIDSIHYSDQSCPKDSVPFEETIILDVLDLPAGIYVVDVNGLKGTFTLQADNIPDAENAVIGGRVWHDECNVTVITGNSEVSPSAGCVDQGDGGYRGNGIMEMNEDGLGGVVIDIGPGLCPSTGLGTTITDSDGLFLFSGLKAGNYCLSVNMANERNAALLTYGEWTYPRGVDDASATVTLTPGQSNLDLNFGWDYQTLDTVEVPEVETECTDMAIFISDVTIPDQTIIPAGEVYTKTWRLRNIGSCTWDSDYSLVRVSGDAQVMTSTVPISATVAPADDVDLSVSLIAPLDPGIYREEWKLRNADGILFGIGPGSDKAFWVEIIVEE